MAEVEGDTLENSGTRHHRYEQDPNASPQSENEPENKKTPFQK
jgi:hypothetical protein